MRHLIGAVVAAFLLVGGEPELRAGPVLPAVSFTGFGPSGDVSATVGWQFATSQDIQVVALGYYDLNGDGLVDSHQVGI
jgi:hypothetical protein